MALRPPIHHPIGLPDRPPGHPPPGRHLLPGAGAFFNGPVRPIPGEGARWMPPHPPVKSITFHPPPSDGGLAGFPGQQGGGGQAGGGNFISQLLQALMHLAVPQPGAPDQPVHTYGQPGQQGVPPWEMPDAGVQNPPSFPGYGPPPARPFNPTNVDTFGPRPVPGLIGVVNQALQRGYTMGGR